MSDLLLSLQPEGQELSVILSYLRAMQVMHQTHHHQSVGDNSYGDHLLFERLYNTVTEEIDQVAERCVGKNGNDSIMLSMQLRRQFRIVKELCLCFDHFTNQRDLVESSLRVELAFLADMQALRDMMEARGALTVGIANRLDGIADAHEDHVYLLEERLGGYVGAVKLAGARGKVAGPYGPSTDEQVGDDFTRKVKMTEKVQDARTKMISARNDLIDAKRVAEGNDDRTIQNTINPLSRAIGAINPLV